MKQLLTILHAEDRLSPSALEIVKGGDAATPMCLVNNCKFNLSICGSNICGANDDDCTINSCEVNCVRYIPIGPGCPTAGTNV